MGIDLLGPFRESFEENTIIAVATNYATWYIEAKAFSDGKATSMTQFILKNISTRHGSPRYLLSDRRATFWSELVTDLVKLMGTTSHFTTSFYLFCNGLVERCNETLADMLAMYVGTDQTDWDKHLSHVIFAYNTAKQNTTKMSLYASVRAPSNISHRSGSHVISKRR